MKNCSKPHTAVPTLEDKRKRDLAAIHAAATKLGFDTADRDPSSEYRSMLSGQCGVTSAAELTAAGRTKVLAHLRSLSAQQGKAPQRYSQQEHIARLWAALGKAGALEDASTAGLNAFVKRMAQVDSVKFLTGLQGSKVIEALKAWQQRHATASATR